MAITSSGCPTVDQDLMDHDFGQDPYPTMERWRALGPVVYNERVDQYMVTGYQNCARALTDVRTFSSEDLQELFIRAFGGVTMEALDTTRHHEMRGVWSRFFQRDALRSQRELVEEVVAAQVDPFVERVRSGAAVDAIPAMTRAIPTLVIARMLGIDETMHRQFSEWSDAMGSTQSGTYDPSPAGMAVVQRGRDATAALNGYIAESVKDRRAHGKGDDLISMMVHDEFANQMSEQEIVASNTQLVFAGNETTAKLMATTLASLAQHPEQLRMLVDDRALIPRAIEEIHRWQTLVQVLPRRVKSDDAEIEGIPIPNGAELKVLIGAGNRDPQRWDHPERLDITRAPRQHLGFGYGMHICLGLSLARLEMQVWLDHLLDRLPEFHLAENVRYAGGLGLRGPEAVQIAV